MLTVDDYTQIREARRDGASVRELAQRFRHSHRTVLKALADPQPKPYTLKKPRSAPVFDAVRSIVDDILAHDQGAPVKQRHTATQIFRRLVTEHNYTGSYHPIQRYLKQCRLDRRATFIPLDHTAGHRLEADFGHIYVDFPDGTNMEYLVHGLRVPYSFEFDPFGQMWLLSNGEGNPNRFLRVIEGVDYHCFTRSGVDNNCWPGTTRSRRRASSCRAARTRNSSATTARRTRPRTAAACSSTTGASTGLPGRTARSSAMCPTTPGGLSRRNRSCGPPTRTFGRRTSHSTPTGTCSSRTGTGATTRAT
ncbi:MAG: hypothetical protein FJ304_20625 [Planctomycetes bacterium]|nr:hypothetical protein [Planctomycetota bacterium]